MIVYLRYFLFFFCGLISGIVLILIINNFQKRKDNFITYIFNEIFRNFRNLDSPLNFNNIYYTLIKILKNFNSIKEILIYRYDGKEIFDIIKFNTINDEKLENIFNNVIYETNENNEYIEVFEQNKNFEIIKNCGNLNKIQNKFNLIRIYPIKFEYSGIYYFIITFLDSKFLNKVINNLLIYFKKQLILVFYSKEIFTKFRDSEELIDHLFNKNILPICYADNEGKILKTNKQFAILFPKTLLNIFALINTDKVDLIKQGFVNEEIINIENKTFKINIIPMFLPAGKIKGYILTFIEEKYNIEHSEKEYFSEKSYKNIINDLPIGFIIITKDGTIKTLNNYLMYSIGMFNQDSIIGRKFQEFFDIQETSFEIFLKKIQEIGTSYHRITLKKNIGNKIYSVDAKKIKFSNEDCFELILQDISFEDSIYNQLVEKSNLLDEELATAKAVWEHILTVLPLYISYIQFETISRPSIRLGGDFYDIFEIDDSHIGVVIADVSGHGVSSALIGAIIKIILEFSPKDPHKIVDMINYLNNTLLRIVPEDQYITLFYGVIDINNLTISYVNCGHPLPMVYDVITKELKILYGMGLPLCSKKNYIYPESSERKLNLSHNCKFLFYTDGILSFKKNNKSLDLDFLKDLFLKYVNLSNKKILNEIYFEIQKSFTPFTNDDITMFLVIINKNPGMTRYFSIPSNVLEIDNVIMYIKKDIEKIILLTDDDNWRLYTALYEALINAVEHGNKFNVQKRVKVRYKILKNMIIFKVCDEGDGFDVNSIPNPLDDSNVLKPSGRGVFMIKKIMDKVKYNKKGNEVLMILKINNNNN